MVELTEEQQIAKKNLIESMAKEIRDLEFYINHNKVENFKIRALKDLKIALQIGKWFAPYALTFGITFGLFSAVGATPLIADNKKEALYTKKTYDSKGRYACEEQYESFHSVDTFSYYGKWQQASDGTYYRQIETYSIKKITREKTLELVKHPDAPLSFIFDEPEVKKVERKTEISAEERDGDSFFEATFYDKDKNDYIIVKEEKEENISASFLFFLVTFLLEGIPYTYRKSRSSFESYDIADIIETINDEYQPKKVSVLRKKLEITKENYERLVK